MKKHRQTLKLAMVENKPASSLASQPRANEISVKANNTLQQAANDSQIVMGLTK